MKNRSMTVNQLNKVIKDQKETDAVRVKKIEKENRKLWAFILATDCDVKPLLEDE